MYIKSYIKKDDFKLNECDYFEVRTATVNMTDLLVDYLEKKESDQLTCVNWHITDILMDKAFCDKIYHSAGSGLIDIMIDFEKWLKEFNYDKDEIKKCVYFDDYKIIKYKINEKTKYILSDKTSYIVNDLGNTIARVN